MNKEKVLQILDEKKIEIQKKFHISRIGLFGSYSKNRQHANSDIDILYELEAGRQLGFKEIEDLENYFKQILSIKQVDLIDKRYINPVIELEIQDELIYV